MSELKERHLRPLAKLKPELQKKAVEAFLALPKQSTKAMECIASDLEMTPVDGSSIDLNDPSEDESQTPIGWYGGKWRLRKKILRLMPQHDIYVEPFFGGGSILFAKQPSSTEIVSDVNHGVVTFFSVLRNSKKAKRLQELLTQTPYSREEHRRCIDPTPTGDEIEDARRFFVRIRQSYSSIEGDSWSLCIKSSRSRANDNANTIDRLQKTAQRLRKVQIESRSFVDLLPKCDKPGAFIYCDPTYPHDTRTGNGNGYLHEMSNDDHRQMLDIVTKYKSAKVILFGYSGEIYDGPLRKWRRHEIDVAVHASGARGKPKSKRKECLWCNW